MYAFGETSKNRLATCHPDLQLIANTAITISHIDFGIAEGHRSVERQKKLFDEGKSRIDGISKLGKHNHMPSMAFDVYAWVDGKASWDEKYLTYIGGVITATAAMLLRKGSIERTLRWGGNWDGDGKIIYDQNFIDLPHFELNIK